MISEKFKVLESARDSYIFIWHNKFYLLKISILPFLLNVICTMFVQVQRSDASVFEAYIWQMPAVFAMGYAVFLQTRLLFMGERFEILPDNISFLKEREALKQASVIIFVLFNMFLSFSGVTLFIISTQVADTRMAFFAMLFIIILFWALRFGMLHIFMAVGVSPAKFIRKVRSMLFSVQLVALTVISLAPVIMIFKVLLASFLPAIEDITELAAADKLVLVLLSAPVTSLTTIVANAALGFAARDMLKGKFST